jgi:hypothetical protein
MTESDVLNEAARLKPPAERRLNEQGLAKVKLIQ